MTAPFIHTHSGKRVDLNYPDPAAINIYDIAVALSRIPRFNGHTNHFYSVAQHSVLVATRLDAWDPETRLCGLLHDAHEAFLGDIVTPVKRCLEGDLGRLALVLDWAISQSFGLPWPWIAQARTAIEAADIEAFAIEARDLMPGFSAGCHPPAHPRIRPWPMDLAAELFLTRFEELIHDIEAHR
jgi:hypothetical protein